MSKKSFLIIAAFVFLLVFQTSCQKKDDSNDKSVEEITNTSNNDNGFVEKKDKIKEEKDNEKNKDSLKGNKENDNNKDNSKDGPKKNKLPDEKVEKEDINIREEEKKPSEGEELESGIFTSSIIADLNGELNNDFPSVYKIDFQDNFMIIYGSLAKMNKEDSISIEKTLENDIYYVELEENTKFSLVGGLSKPTIMKADEFKKYFKEVENSGLGLVLEIEDGKLYSASISS
ncbi:hypothetical protein ACFOW0_01620 [Citroniella saccharovorans]